MAGIIVSILYVCVSPKVPDKLAVTFSLKDLIVLSMSSNILSVIECDSSTVISFVCINEFQLGSCVQKVGGH